MEHVRWLAFCEDSTHSWIWSSTTLTKRPRAANASRSAWVWCVEMQSFWWSRSIEFSIFFCSFQLTNVVKQKSYLLQIIIIMHHIIHHLLSPYSRFLLIYFLFCSTINFILLSNLDRFISFHTDSHSSSSSCGPGHFLSSSGQCYSHLNCGSLSSIRPLVFLVNGTVKHVQLARWNHEMIVISTPTNDRMLPDFRMGLETARQFDQSQANDRFTSQYLGHCDRRIMFTRYEPLGDCLNAHHILTQPKFAFRFTKRLRRFETLARRSNDSFRITMASSLRCFQLCISYVQVIRHLHSGRFGVRVMCDGNDLTKLLTQFLLAEPDRVILNDLDALPDASSGPIRCGQNELKGNLVAPEQRASLNATYDEKIDIWRIPSVCRWFMQVCDSNSLFDSCLQSELALCHHSNPLLRPSASHLLNRLQMLNHTMFHEYFYDHQ